MEQYNDSIKENAFNQDVELQKRIHQKNAGTVIWCSALLLACGSIYLFKSGTIFVIILCIGCLCAFVYTPSRKAKMADQESGRYFWSTYYIGRNYSWFESILMVVAIIVGIVGIVWYFGHNYFGI